ILVNEQTERQGRLGVEGDAEVAGEAGERAETQRRALRDPRRWGREKEREQERGGWIRAKSRTGAAFGAIGNEEEGHGSGRHDQARRAREVEAALGRHVREQGGAAATGDVLLGDPAEGAEPGRPCRTDRTLHVEQAEGEQGRRGIGEAAARELRSGGGQT